ncbi:hypothetical protein BZA05DRAFT_454423 [Tricharina praecox]|uniref:uncharacterized protein n=1 Tax=Tricharina praecox TaxID=43433 RepID=UPI002220519F|nr:uncharacterized protein BZA05DRAFT_466583 [Tricharina praecox]XP_051338755.1 uncharacterized protein BZA05DRAFT_454423 [Tricharina praecox]KAI5840635.1 hypothetical protein BZA05DRAFT_466583 [Tricharina praecox]KAI5850111.1 hypothetical protein BZA05DRAFT_454423 [Tricharina praecox]
MQSPNAPEHPAHIVRIPHFLFIMRLVQIFLSVVILALMAFAITQLTNVFGTFGYNIFCCIYNFIGVGYLLVSVARAPRIWNCWAALVIDIFGVIFWISAWGSLAGWAALGNIAYDSSALDLCRHYSKTDQRKCNGRKGAWQASAATAGLGAIVWVLFVVHLIVYSIHLHRHRTAPETKHLPSSGRALTEEEKGAEMNVVSPQGVYSA